MLTSKDPVQDGTNVAKITENGCGKLCQVIREKLFLE
jgi:hypothetical protein